MPSPKRRLISTLGLLTCSTLLMGCEPKQIEPRAVVQPSTRSADSAARKAEIVRQIRAVCPTPTQWTPAQKRAVAGFIEQHAGETGNDLLAREWSRLNAGARLCRGE